MPAPMETPSPIETRDIPLARCRNWLLAAYARSEPGAAEAFVRAYDCLVYKAALHVLGMREDSEDAAQESLLRLFTMARTGQLYPMYDSRGCENSYVRTTAMRVALNRRRRQQESQTASGIDLCAMPDSRPVGLDDTRLDRLWTCLGRLSQLDSGIIELRFFGGLSVQETADKLGIPPGTVKSRTATALGKLTRCCCPNEEQVDDLQQSPGA
jgi:RNA polymerase sigma-70 factor (ECF subfamily)